MAYNPSNSGCDLTITPYTGDGHPLSAITRHLSGKEKYIGTIRILDFPTAAAWFRISSTRPIIGFELFSTIDGAMLAGFFGINANRKKGTFPKIEKDGWTGIAFVNIADNDTKVNLDARDDAGNLIATKIIDLFSHQRVVDLAEGLFDDDISGATYIYFDSGEVEIVGFQLNTSLDGEMLDCLPAL